LDQLNSASEPLGRTIIIYIVHRNVYTKALKIINLAGFVGTAATGVFSISIYSQFVSLRKCNIQLFSRENQEICIIFINFSFGNIEKITGKMLFTENYGPLVGRSGVEKLLTDFFFPGSR
jgi:hypothetical protein